MIKARLSPVVGERPDRRLVRELVDQLLATGDHVTIVLPAHNEAAHVADVVSRIPEEVCGMPVRCLVVDDGSSDGTAEAAVAAGAVVVAHASNRGLGAAVRSGLAAAIGSGAAVVAFCDADGEYAPEELERLVCPIVAGRADYVVGSRSTGRLAGMRCQMRPYRRAGNSVLTRWVRWMVRQRVTDGQSGYRALSRVAAGAAEIAHDYNYAQVLTLDLVRKGFVYAEVPISYRARASSQSFVRLLPYLRTVVPTVWRQLQGGGRR